MSGMVGAAGQALDDRRAAGDGVASRFGERDPCAAAGDGDDIGGADTNRTENDIARRVFHQSVTYVSGAHRAASVEIRIGG